MRSGLAQLGYKSFHGAVLQAAPWKFPYWEEAIRAKYFGEGKPYGRAEFDKLLHEYDVVVNYPSTMFAEEMIEAYPDAKVILTLRDVHKWKASLTNAVDASAEWKSWDWLAPFDPIWGPWWRYHKLEHAIRPLMAPRGEKQGFLDYYSRIRSMVPKERLLEYHVGEGWERLCDFLELPIPEEPFPHDNSKGQFMERRRERWNHALQCMLVRVVPATLVAASIVVAAWWHRSSNLLALA